MPWIDNEMFTQMKVKLRWMFTAVQHYLSYALKADIIDLETE